MKRVVICLLVLIVVVAAASLAQDTVLRADTNRGQDSGDATKVGSAGDATRKPLEVTLAVDVPNAPHGLFVILIPRFQMKNRNADAYKYLLHNPVVSGANIFVIWSHVDRGPASNPRYDWASVDEAIAPWVAAGKTVNFIVWAVAWGHGKPATPDYVLSQVPTLDCPNFGHVPVFWNKAFMNSYQAFMSAFVQKYGTNRSVSYIRFGLGGGGETHPPCRVGLVPFGFSAAIWRKYLFEMLDFESSLNSPKQLLVSLPPLDLSDDVAAYAVQRGIGIGTQGLSAAHIRSYESGSPCPVNWCGLFDKFRGKVPLELQTFAPSHPDRSDPGSLVDLLPFGLRLHAQIFEIYPEDWLLAYDPTFPGYSQYHDEYQQAFQAAANVVGGR